MTLSLNEIEATAKKAARGAGYPWGLAEEAGKATRWLCSHDVDGCKALAELLPNIDGRDIASRTPQIGNEPWTAKDGLLCPLATGAAISDRAHEIEAKGIKLGAVASPALLAPFIALLARELEKTMEVSVSGFTLRTDGAYSYSEGTPPASSVEASIDFGGTINRPGRFCQRAEPNPKDWSTLLAFARRTYAPATENSRLKGAGAELSDND